MAEKEASVELVPREQIDSMVAALVSGEGIEYADPSEIQAAIVARILSAETETEAFGEAETWSSRDLVGVPFEVYTVRIFRSRFGEQGGGFVAADVTRLDTGERGILTTSAAKVAARLLWLYLHDALPRKVVVRELETETASGYKPLRLESVA